MISVENSNNVPEKRKPGRPKKTELSIRDKAYLAGQLDGRSKYSAALKLGNPPSNIEKSISAVLELPTFKNRLHAIFSDDDFIRELVSLVHAEKTYLSKHGEVSTRDNQAALRALELIGRINGAFTMDNMAPLQENFNVQIILKEKDKSDENQLKSANL